MSPVFLRDIASSASTLDHLSAYVMIWHEVLSRSVKKARDHDEAQRDFISLLEVKREMGNVIGDLADRKRRLRDAEFSSERRLRSPRFPEGR